MQPVSSNNFRLVRCTWGMCHIFDICISKVMRWHVYSMISIKSSKGSSKILVSSGSFKFLSPSRTVTKYRLHWITLTLTLDAHTLLVYLYLVYSVKITMLQTPSSFIKAWQLQLHSTKKLIQWSYTLTPTQSS